MQLNKEQEVFIINNKETLQGIFDVWIAGLTEELINEDDKNKTANLQKFLREFKMFRNTMELMNKEELENKEAVL